MPSAQCSVLTALRQAQRHLRLVGPDRRLVEALQERMHGQAQQAVLARQELNQQLERRAAVAPIAPGLRPDGVVKKPHRQSVFRVIVAAQAALRSRDRQAHSVALRRLCQVLAAEHDETFADPV